MKSPEHYARLGYKLMCKWARRNEPGKYHLPRWEDRKPGNRERDIEVTAELMKAIIKDLEEGAK